MTARLLDGRPLAAELLQQLAAERDKAPLTLAVVAVGEDAGAASYRRSLATKLTPLGGRLQVELWPESIGVTEARAALRSLSDAPNVHGILLQEPLPSHLAGAALWRQLDPAKDVEGHHPENLGRLWLGENVLLPCTAAAVSLLLAAYDISLAGMRAVVIGRSPLVGKAIAHVLTAADATVTLCHSRTRDLAGHLATADLIVSAVGRPGLLQGPELPPGAIVIDVATSRDAAGKLVGDCGPDVASHVAALSPVPGGVGPLTAVALVSNLIEAAKRQGR